MRGFGFVALGALFMTGILPTYAALTPQQACDGARSRAWARYGSCADHAVHFQDATGLIGGGGIYAERFFRCRHAYFLNWPRFQRRWRALAGSTCIASSRFTDNADGTVTDALTSLVWEKKTQDASVHDVTNIYTWSTGAPWNPDGTAFTDFLGTVNGVGFAGANDWRVPTLAELQTILLDFPCSGRFGGLECSCALNCIDGIFGPTQFQGNNLYWSSTVDSVWPNPKYPQDPWGVAWGVGFWEGDVGTAFEGGPGSSGSVRAVRGGL